MLNVKDIIKSKFAIYHEEGLSLFGELSTLVNKGQSIVLSFEGIQRCSTQFLNASIGKLYLQYNPAVIDNLLSLESESELKEKISHVRENAINSKEYNRLIQNAIA